MSDNIVTDKNSEKINSNFERDIELQKIKEQVLKKFSEYRTTMNYLAADAPIEILCLPKTIETLLIAANCLRVYDLINRDLTEIKGLGETRIRDLASRLDEFFSML